MKSSSWSPHEAATDSSSGDQAHDIGKLLCPESVSRCSPVCRSQIFRFLSFEADRSFPLSLEKAMQVTLSSCPLRILPKITRNNQVTLIIISDTFSIRLMVSFPYG